MKYVDLHVHSTASDGTLTPSEVVERAASLSLAAIALTDHDTTAGVTEAKKKAIDMLTKAQTASKTLQQNAINSVNKLMNDTELHYSRALQEMKVMKSRIEGKATASANKQK